MWQSQDDIIKDLASLNDFGSPEDKEPYKALYSIGRGSKHKEKNKSSEKFIDLRTGEDVEAEDVNLGNDYWNKGKGRGSLLGGFSRSKFQLQQQLRLARPLGSGDEAIESYCRRNQPVKNPRSSNTTLDSETDSKRRQITAGNLNHNLNLDRKELRIKAVRNSSTHSNALINGLLTNCSNNSEIQTSGTAEKFVRIEDEKKDEENLNINCKDLVNCSVSDDNVENSCNEFSTRKISNSVDEFSKEDLSGKPACLKDIFDSSDKTVKLNTAAPVVNCETLNYFEEEEEEERNEKINDIKDSQNNLENNFYDSAKTQHERNEKYRLLGERLNRLRKTGPKGSGIYEFSEISKCIAPMYIESETCSTIVTNTVPTPFVVKDEEFPPLLNGNR